MHRLSLCATLLLLLSAASPRPLRSQAVARGGAVFNVGPAAPVTLTVLPTTSIVSTTSTQNFTFTINNDFGGKGATLALSGTGCAGATCGALSTTLVHTGNIVTYTGPAAIPSPPTVVLTATSVQDPTKTAVATITVNSSAPNAPISINLPIDIPAKIPAAASNSFLVGQSAGNGAAVVITGPSGITISGVVLNPGAIPLTSVGCSGDTATGGHIEQWYTATPIAPGITSVVVNLSVVVAGNIDIAFLDLNNMASGSLDGTGICTTTNTPTTTPVGPAIVSTSPGDLLVAGIVVFDAANGVAAPFTFSGLPREDGVATLTNAPTGTATPAWASTSGAYATVGAAYRSGTSPAVIAVSVNPTSSSVQNSTTRSFSAAVSNDPAAAGVSWTLTGANCAGATCGTVSPATSASSASITYTAPAAVPSPSPVVTLTATSVTDGGKSAAATITVTATPTINVVISPTSGSFTAGGTGGNFTATVTNDSQNRGVGWRLTEGSTSCASLPCGTVSPVNTASGVATTFTPPATVPSPQSVTLIAESVTDPTKSATASILVSLPNQACVAPNCPAFAGAQGGGAASVGGRGGVVYNITTTDDNIHGGCVPFNSDSVTCSLRDCIAASGARYCIFRLSGLITQHSRLGVLSPFIYIAGQTAPGGGIVLGGAGQAGEGLDVQTHDVIVRYLTYDGNNGGGSQANPCPTSGPNTGTVGFEEALGGSTSVFNVIFDHLSGRWVNNKFLIYANDSSGNTTIHDSTWQWSLFYEPCINHPVGPLMTAIAFPSRDVNNDWHHNAFINTGHRIPLSELQNWRWVSNITFNWDYFAAIQDGSSSDFISNLWVAGNLNAGNSNPHPVNATLGTGGGAGNCLANCDLPGTPSIYMTGNVGPQGTDYQLTAEEAGTDPEGFPEVVSPIRVGWRRSTPLPAEAIPITADPPSNLSNLLTPTLGNSLHLACDGTLLNNRDSQDARVIAQFKAVGPGGEFQGPNYNGPASGPVIVNAAPCVESLHDGLPDVWKTKYGRSTSDPTLYKTVDQKWGVPYLEVYLDGRIP